MKSAKKHKGGFWIVLDPETLEKIERLAKENCRSMRQEITFIIGNVGNNDENNYNLHPHKNYTTGENREGK